ncbi:MAG TPA: DUF6461 domain-containing protein [Phytomonospora sp.]
MSDATAAGYAWLEERYPDLTSAYCLTIARGFTPAALLKAVGAEPTGTVVGVEPMHDLSFEAWDRHHGDRLLVGAAAVGEWAVMVEVNGYLGSLDEYLRPLAADGGRAVSHFRNENAVDRFNYFDDGGLRLYFEPLFAFHRDGPDAEVLAPEMLAAGFDLGDDEETEPDYENHTEAAWALGERLTGVRVTPELLETGVFACGLVTVR